MRENYLILNTWYVIAMGCMTVCNPYEWERNSGLLDLYEIHRQIVTWIIVSVLSLLIYFDDEYIFHESIKY